MNYCSIHNSFLFTYLKHIIHNPVIIIFSLQNIAKKKNYRLAFPKCFSLYLCPWIATVCASAFMLE